MGKVETGGLDNLIAAVEAGRDDSNLWRPALGDCGVIAMQAHHGSIDAAKRLHDALLPGWEWAIQNDAATVIFSHAEAWRVWDVPIYSAECKGNPARAWLLAILRAVQSLPGNGGVTATAARPGSGDA